MNLKNLKYNKKYYQIIFNNKTIYIKKKHNTISLLKILILHKVHINYECQNGYCGTCSVKLIKGKIIYFHKNIIAVIKSKYILPCCCRINSNIQIIN